MTVSKEDKSIEADMTAPQFYNVFRPKASTITVQSPAKFAIVDGSLIVSDGNGEMRFILGPGLWSSVGINPN